MNSPERPTTMRHLLAPLIIGLMAFSSLTACRSASTPPLSVQDQVVAIEALNKPHEGDPAALYRLRVPSAGGLRLSVLTDGGEGRMTIAESFGSAISLTAWSGTERPTFFDMREGCRVESADLSRVLGVAAMPMPQAIRLLSGRLPMLDGDDLRWLDDGRLQVDGAGWAATLTISPDPWRVLSVAESTASGKGWRLELSEHEQSVPGRIGIKKPGQRWVELELVRLEWRDGRILPTLPDLPECGAADRQ